MSHYAQIDENNIVIQVIVADQDFIDSGAVGNPSSWLQTSYNTRSGLYYIPNSDQLDDDQSKAFRKNFAGIGYTYDPIRDAFIPPKPNEQYILNEFTCQWESLEVDDSLTS